MDTMSPAGGAGSFSFDDSFNSSSTSGQARGRGQAAPVLKELVGDVVLEARPVEGKRSPEISARFTGEAAA